MEITHEYLTEYFHITKLSEFGELMAKISGIKVPLVDTCDWPIQHYFDKSRNYHGFRFVPHLDESPIPLNGWLVIDDIVDLTVPIRMTIDPCFEPEYFPETEMAARRKLEQGLESLVRESEKHEEMKLKMGSLREFFADNDNFVMFSSS